jgi:hypothetical protein
MKTSLRVADTPIRKRVNTVVYYPIYNATYNGVSELLWNMLNRTIYNPTDTLCTIHQEYFRTRIL